MQTPALFTMAQSSPQPQSVDTVTYARVKPLPSPGTISTSGELRRYIDSDGRSPSLNPGPTGSSQELLLRGSQQPPPITSVAPPYTATVPHLSQSHLPSWRTEWNNLVSPRQIQLSPIGQSKAGFVDHNHAHRRWFIHHQSSLRLLNTGKPHHHRGTGPLFPLSCPSSRSCNHRTIDLPLRRITRAPTLHQGDVLVQRSTKSTLLVLHKFPQASHRYDMANVHHEAHSSHPPEGKTNPFAPTQGIPHLSRGPNFCFHEFTNPHGINTLQGIHVPERINYTFSPPQHTLKPTASSCSLGQLENEYV